MENTNKLFGHRKPQITQCYPVTDRYGGQVGACSDCHRDGWIPGEFMCGGGGPGPGLLSQNHSVRLKSSTQIIQEKNLFQPLAFGTKFVDHRGDMFSRS